MAQLGWSTLGEARDPARIRPGVMLVAGTHSTHLGYRCSAWRASCQKRCGQRGDHVARDFDLFENWLR
jgi:hypothetical protein